MSKKTRDRFLRPSQFFNQLVMTKTLEIIFILFLATASFFLGVKYSKNVKEYGLWIFEPNDSGIELPELSDTENINIDTPPTNSNINSQQNILDQATPPDEDQNIVPSIE